MPVLDAYSSTNPSGRSPSLIPSVIPSGSVSRYVRISSSIEASSSLRSWFGSLFGLAWKYSQFQPVHAVRALRLLLNQISSQFQQYAKGSSRARARHPTNRAASLASLVLPKKSEFRIIVCAIFLPCASLSPFVTTYRTRNKCAFSHSISEGGP